MRKILLVMALTMAPFSMAHADNDVGCGVGTEVMAGQKGAPAKLMASFTNALTFQSVSITFGLMNCKTTQEAVTVQLLDAKVRHYASQNIDRLYVEMATGQGEHLDGLAHLLGVPSEDRASFATLTQSHFEELFSHDRVTVGEVLSSLQRVLAEDTKLSAYARS